jgi:hypothetical protein
MLNRRSTAAELAGAVSVVLIELLLAKIDTGLKVGGVGHSDLILRRLEVREDEVHASKDFM